MKYSLRGMVNNNNSSNSSTVLSQLVIIPFNLMLFFFYSQQFNISNVCQNLSGFSTTELVYRYL